MLNDLYVDTAYRKQGIGEKLIKKAMDFAKTNGSTQVQGIRKKSQQCRQGRTQRSDPQ
ncbi:MAG: N-acetyltransferase [Sphingobacteriales bacterium]|nr:MAG: N-acetyltransferase [Sphingobacteriales bacterium]